MWRPYSVNAVGYNEIDITIPPVHKNDFLHGENAVSFELTAMEAGNPLTMTVMGGDGIINVSNPSEGMKYSINDGDKEPIICESWSNIYSIEVSHDDEVHFYGNGTNGSTNIIVNSNVMLTGNIMSLVDEENFATITTMEGASFAGLFAGNNFFETIIDVSGLLLPATELVDSCYFNMFDGCENLEALICLATTINGTDCTKEWLYGVNNSGTFTKAKGASFWTPNSSDGIPWGWTVNEY